MAKRVIDLAGSAIGLVILMPFFLLIALFVKLTSPGPVFYLQERIGLRGIPFQLVKFRTMKIDSDKYHAITVGKKDSRITALGYWLRKFKIDELPQLINVVRGEMSLVGPRPELRKFTDLYNPQQRRVLDVRPGMTDPASIQFRNENEMLDGKPDPIGYYTREILPVKLALNIKYMEDRSSFKDVRIILQTLVSIFKST